VNHAPVDQIARAVLYEGYILYPYRPSVKNRQRWTFGGLAPRAACQAEGDAWTMQTQCLVRGDPGTTLTVTVRFLQLVARLVGELAGPLPERPEDGEPPVRFVETLRVGEAVWHSWQEAVERTVDLGDSDLGALASGPRRSEFAFSPHRDREPVRGPAGAIVGVILRERRHLEGTVELSAEAAGEGVFRVSVTIRNQTPWEHAGSSGRDEVLLRSLVSTHTILGVRGGAFVSSIDPPESCRAAAAGCRNVGTWPVLVGTEGQTDTMLSASIILYDYPQVAPESPGDLFDATEIDEILTLRILTLTDEEKRAMSAVDERARALLERTEALGRDQLLGLHGAVRDLRPIPEEHSDG
jgi:hypothetical protein